jgi:hypothetical protein
VNDGIFDITSFLIVGISAIGVADTRSADILETSPIPPPRFRMSIFNFT